MKTNAFVTRVSVRIPDRMVNHAPHYPLYARPYRLWAMLALCVWLVTSAIAVTSYPDMANVAKPYPEPSLPAGSDTYAPPVNSVTIPATAPTIAEWTRIGAPGDNLVLTGDQLSANTGADEGKDTSFLVYGQTGTNGSFKTAKIQRLDGMKATILLNSALPTWSMYLLWVKNANGYSAPVAINRTEAWWLGPKKAERGATISAFGRNLSHDNGTTSSWIYIKKPGQSGQWATVTAVNPYKVDFTVPNDLTNGDYEVWVHNGHGGHYGWSGPLTLTVYDGPGWTGTQFNVRDYGAVGDGSTDDEVAINNALTAAAASPRSTLYFPAGTYLVSKGFVLPSNVRWMGDGKTLTTIRLSAGFVYDGTSRKYCLLNGNTAGLTNVEIRDMTLDGNEKLAAAQNKLIRSVYGASDIAFTNVKFLVYSSTNSIGYGALHLSNISRLFVKGCDFYAGEAAYMNTVNQVFYDSCNYYCSNDADTCTIAQVVHDYSVTNCTARNYDTSLDTGYGTGRVVKGGAGRNYHIYTSDVTSYNMSPRTTGSGLPDQNTGEQILWETSQTLYQGSPSSATATTVTFSNLSTNYGSGDYHAVIIRGKGLGQYRRITAYNAGTITLEQPWNVIPDTASLILIQAATNKVAIYHNTLDGRDPTAATASAGIQYYCGGYDFVIDNNTITDVVNGIYAHGRHGTNTLLPAYFNIIQNNSVTNCRTGLVLLGGSYDDGVTDPGICTMANLFRHNTVTGISSTAIGMSKVSATTRGIMMDMNVFERNAFTNVPTGINTTGNVLTSALKTTVFYQNTFNRGTATYAGSKGLLSATGQLHDLRENTFSNFETVYSGTLPGAELEAPYRIVTVNGSTGTATVTGDLPLWNAGTASLSWTASKSADWLTLSATSGIIADQNSSSTITLTCNPTGLSVGTYTDTVTITVGAQTKKATIIFNVVAPGTGLNAKYYNNQYYNEPYALARTDATVNFDWGTGSPDALVNADNFGSRWTGSVRPRYSEQYTIYINADDSAIVWIDGQQVVSGNYQAEASGTISLQAGRLYSIRVDHREGAHGARCILSWSSASQTKEVIPQACLYTNIAPTVSLTAPTNNSVINEGSDATISANASDSDGTISLVEFFANGAKVGEDSGSPYTMTWTAPAYGTYSITAVATDNLGGTQTSSPVSLKVNRAPFILLTAPTSGTRLASDVGYDFTANAWDGDGTISKVEFFVDGNKVGEDATSPYSYTWTSTALGSHTVYARSIDNDNLPSENSGSVSIIVGHDGTGITGTYFVANNWTNAVLSRLDPAINFNWGPSTLPGSAYSIRWTGFVKPLYSETYTFYLNCDTSGTLWVNDTQICTGDYHGETSGTITLTAGTAYTIKCDVRKGTNCRGIVSWSSTSQPKEVIPTQQLFPNAAPTVSITSPADGATVSAPVTINASASDSDGTIAKVEFWYGTTKLGEDSSSPYSYTWSSPTAGAKTIKAVAVDNKGACGVATISITVQ